VALYSVFSFVGLPAASAADSTLDAGAEKMFYEGLRQFEQRWFNRKVILRIEDFTDAIEVNSTGMVIRRVQTPSGGKIRARTASYGMVEHGQIVRITEHENLPPGVEQRQPGVSFLQVADVPSLMEKMIGFPRAGFLNGQPISKWVEQGQLAVRKDLKHEGDGVLAIECHRDGYPTLTFWFDMHNRLTGVDERCEAGIVFGAGYLVPDGMQVVRLDEWYYASSDDQFPSKFIAKVRDRNSRGDAVSIADAVVFAEQSTLAEALPNRITLPPTYVVKEGMPVVCGERPGNEFRIHDGIVVAVVNGTTLEEIESLHWKSSGGSRFGYYAVLCALLVVVVAVIIWRRS
jgi:hypothetical protein